MIEREQIWAAAELIGVPRAVIGFIWSVWLLVEYLVCGGCNV